MLSLNVIVGAITLSNHDNMTNPKVLVALIRVFISNLDLPHKITINIEVAA